MIDLSITFNKKLLKEILFKLNSMEKKMATLEENTATIAEIAAAVEANTGYINSINEMTIKIFDEVEKLALQANMEIPGLAELKAAVLAQTPALIAATSKNTEIDGLIPDSIIDPVI